MMATGELLAIETALEGLQGADASFSEKYRLMKNRLLNVEYEHWAAGFPEGNNHGRGHITRVLGYLDLLLGSQPLKYLDPYELFLAMMSILYHDIGLLQQRKKHADISKVLLEGDTNDAYIINAIDKDIIAAAVVSHSSSKDIAKECSRFLQEEIVGKHRARPRVIAALVRLADELDEDHRRADPILQRRLNLPPESHFFWLFCQRVHGIRPNLLSKRIDFSLALEAADTTTYGPVPGGKVRHFIAFVAEKLAKINQERVAVNRFLPGELQYGGLHVDVKPWRDHPEWHAPLTFVFNDQTSSEMFLHSFPQLLDEPAKEAMGAILTLMKDGNLEKAATELDRLESVIEDLPVHSKLGIYYEKACVLSMKAARLPEGSPEREQALDQAAEHVVAWFELGKSGAFKKVGRTAAAEAHRLASDADLALVRAERSERIPTAIPKLRGNHGAGAGAEFPGSGCVPLGTLIDTPIGLRPVEQLGPGDDVVSLRLGGESTPVNARVAAVVASRSPRCIRLNKLWFVTPNQPLHTSTGWVKASEISKGDTVTDRNGLLLPIVDLATVDGYFEVFDLTIDDASHNYVANGLLCHNKKIIKHKW
jgi:hypothetical protein